MKDEMIRQVISLIISIYPGFFNRINWLTPNDMVIGRVRYVVLMDIMTFVVLMGVLSVLFIWSAFDPV